MAKTPLTERATSAKSDLWGTPRDLAMKLVKEFDLRWDVAACQATAVLPTTLIQPMFYFGPDHPDYPHDALGECWGSWFSRGFMNPPFSQLDAFVRKATDEMANGVTTVALLPANKSEQPWWHECVPLASEVRWLKGRLTYLEPELDSAHTGEDPVYLLNGVYRANTPALFPSCVVVWDGSRPKGLIGGPRWTFWDWRKD